MTPQIAELAATFTNIFSKSKVPKAKTTGAATPTFNPQSPQEVLTLPTYREHLKTLVDARLAENSRDLIEQLFSSDPDVSAAVNAYLTMADTDWYIEATDINGKVDGKTISMAYSLIKVLTNTQDYSNGFSYTLSMRELCAEMRYMVLLRGGVGGEVVFGDGFIPVSFKNIDLKNVEWTEKKVGDLKPQQTINGETISLDIPSFFVAYHRKSPLTMYPTSNFVSAINTIAARQQLINDLYRVMSITGFPRLDVSVAEEVILANAPAEVRSDVKKRQDYVRSTLAGITNTLSSLSSDKAFVHLDSVTSKIVNEKNPAAGLDISHIINTLNAQNQAGLKAMATILGRGESGVNTASVEARIFSMSADQLNVPIAALFSRMLTLLCRMNGSKSVVEVTFIPAELRPDLELEPQKTLRQTRLQRDLSLGLITDDEYHMKMYHRPRSSDMPLLSGTGFNEKTQETKQPEPSGNDDPLGKSLSPDGSEAVKDNRNKN